MDWLAAPLLVTCAILASLLAWQGSATRLRLANGLTALIAIDLARILCVVPGAAAREAAWAAGIVPPALAGLDRWRWSGGWAATLAWYAVTTWIVVVTLKNEGPALCHERGLRGGSERSGATKRNEVDERHIAAMLVRAAVALAAPLAAVALYLAYPWLRGWRIEILAVVAYAVGLGVQLAAATRASLDWRVPAAAERAAWLTGWILTASTISSAAGAWALAHPVRDWYATRWLAVLTWAAVGGVHLWALTRRRE